MKTIYKHIRIDKNTGEYIEKDEYRQNYKTKERLQQTERRNGIKIINITYLGIRNKYKQLNFNF